MTEATVDNKIANEKQTLKEDKTKVFIIPISSIEKLSNKAENFYDNIENQSIRKLSENIKNKFKTKIIIVSNQVKEQVKNQVNTNDNQLDWDKSIFISENEEKQEQDIFVDLALLTPEHLNAIKQFIVKALEDLKDQHKYFVEKQLKEFEKAGELLVEQKARIEEKIKNSYNKILKSLKIILFDTKIDPIDNINIILDSVKDLGMNFGFIQDKNIDMNKNILLAGYKIVGQCLVEFGGLKQEQINK